MAGLISSITILFFVICYMSIGSSAANNTTQFDNYTIEWEDFSLFTCAIPSTINISSFTCLPSARYTQVDDISCLVDTEIDFDVNTCQSTTAALMYTTSASITTQQTTMMTSSVASTQASTGMTPSTTHSTTIAGVTNQSSATTAATHISITNTTATTTIAGTTDTSTTTNATIHSLVTATTIGSGSINTPTPTTASSSTPATTGSSSTTATTGSSSVGAAIGSSSSLATTGSSSVAAAISSSSTPATTGSASTTANAGSSSINTTTTTTTIGSTTTTTAGNIYDCPSEYYIGVYCNMSSDACAMSQPCLNAATCFPNNTLPLGYRCQCQAGFTGYNCESDERACFEGACWNNGTCVAVNTTVSSNNGSDFRCECVAGYDGVYCELQIDLCGNITCENRGICETVELMWKCLCLDSSLYYGDYCQFKTSRLEIQEILSKSFASIAIAAIITTCTFIAVMDLLKYVFNIDPVEPERDSYRKRREAQKRARHPIKNGELKLALRFQYVS